MPEVRNAMSQAIADLYYLRLDTTNNPLTGDLQLYKTEPTITFTDLGAATADEDWSIGTLDNDFIIENLDSDISGHIILDQHVYLRRTVPSPGVFTGYYGMYSDPTIAITAAVSSYFLIKDASSVTLSTAYGSFGIISAGATVTETGKLNLDAVYLFVNDMTIKSTAAGNPPSVHSFDSKPHLKANDATFDGACPEFAGFNDWATVEAAGGYEGTLSHWASLNARKFSAGGTPTYYMVYADGVGSYARVINKYTIFAEELMIREDNSGIAELVAQFIVYANPLTTADTVNCGMWLGKQSGGDYNYGIMLDGDGIGADIGFGRGNNVRGEGAAAGDSFAVAAGIVTFTDAAGLFTSAMVGEEIVISDAVSIENDGVFTIASYISATQITWANASGVAENFPEIGKWAIYSDPDARIYYDGTNLIIDPDVVGSGKVYIGTTGDDDLLLNDIEIDGDLNHDGTGVGFYGTAPITVPDVGGVKAGGTALTNLIAALVNLGLITDSTT